MYCLQPLENWDHEFESHSRHRCISSFSYVVLSCVQVEALRRADPPSKGSKEPISGLDSSVGLAKNEDRVPQNTWLHSVRWRTKEKHKFSHFGFQFRGSQIRPSYFSETPGNIIQGEFQSSRVTEDVLCRNQSAISTLNSFTGLVTSNCLNRAWRHRRLNGYGSCREDPSHALACHFLLPRKRALSVITWYLAARNNIEFKMCRRRRSA